MILTSLLLIPHKAATLNPIDNTWDCYLEHQLVASGLESQCAAQMELDLIAFHAMFGESLLDPHGIVTDEAIDLALAIVRLLFVADAVRQRAERAVREIIRTMSDVPIYSIEPDGSLHVLASCVRKGQPRSYQITTMVLPRSAEDDHLPERYRIREACDCLDFQTHTHAHGGVCKHVAARLMLFLAQQGVGALKHVRDALTRPPALELAIPQPNIAVDDALTFVELPAKLLAGACFIPFLSGMPVQVEVRDGQLLLRAGQALISVPGSTGCGTSTATLDAATFAQFWHALKAAVKHGLAETTLCIFVDPAGLFVCSPDQEPVFALQVPEPVPIAQRQEGEVYAATYSEEPKG